MSEFFKLIMSSVEFSKEYRTGEYKRITFPVLSGTSYCIYQKYPTIPLEFCYWELHEDFVDVNVWLDGEEELHSSSTSHDLSGMKLDSNDFWKTEKNLSVENTVILNNMTPIVLFNTNMPHKCQIKKSSGFIEKLTLKIHREDIARIL